MSTHSSTQPLFVAIDIGKNVHCYGAYAGLDLREVQPPTMVLSHRGGYEPFRDWLRGLLASGKYDPVVIGVETTGIYHESWVDALLADFPAPLAQVRQLNPFVVKRKRQELTSGRKRKNDPLDVKAITHCLRDGQGQPARARNPQHLPFELWTTSLRQTQQALYRSERQILSQFDRLWPSGLVQVQAFQRAHPELELPEPLVRTEPLQRQLIQLLLQKRPDPYDWLPANSAAIQDFYRTEGMRCGPKTAQHVLDVLERSLFPHPEVACLLAEQLSDDFNTYQLLEQRYQELLDQADILLPGSPAEVLLSFGGIAAKLAARYWSFVCPIERFATPGQIWSLAGYDLVQNDSGDRRRFGKITKRGDGALRWVLYQLGLTTSQHSSVIAQAKQRALQHGKGTVGAVLHAAHKANRICFHLLVHQEPFDPAKAR